jgi:hypothetical protein
MSMETTEEQRQRAEILIEQADRLLVKLAVDVSEVPTRDPTQGPWRCLPRSLPVLKTHTTALPVLRNA